MLATIVDDESKTRERVERNCAERENSIERDLSINTAMHL